MKKSSTIAVLVILFGVAPTAFGATDYLLKLGGIDGETTKSNTAPTTTATKVDSTAPSQTTISGDPDFDLLKVSPPPPSLPPGDPDFDLLRVAPASPPVSTGDHDFDLLRVTPPATQAGKVNIAVGDVNGDGSGAAAKGSVEAGWKVEEGTKLKGVEPDEIDYKDDDDDGDNVPTKDEDVNVAVSNVVVRGWDPKKKEEFMSERKEAAEVHSKQDLEHFAQGVLLDDEKIADVQFNPKELSVSYEAEGKILWFIPVSYTERLIAKGEEGGGVTFTSKKPWWGFIVSANEDGDEAAKTASDKHKESIEIASWSWGVSNQAQLLKTISNVLKTKHDTAKNSVGNIR